MKLLNILNGGSTLHIFNVAKLPGDTLVWRETLSEGPVQARSEDDFFKLRSEWISEAYHADAAAYQNNVINEFNKLKSFRKYDEVLFWFEFDLFCQVNLVFLLSFFKNKKLGKIKLALICPNEHPNHPDFRGIGQLSPSEFSELPAQKVYLNTQDIQFASKAWEAYLSADPKKIEDIIQEDPGHLDKLPAAFAAHLQRFPDKKSGLNRIEESLVDLVNSGINKRDAVYHEFWKKTAIYGMGDAQIDLYIKRLVRDNKIPQFKDDELRIKSKD